MQLKKARIEHFGLPDIPYPLPISFLEESLSNGEEVSFSAMLFGLQVKSEQDCDNWRQYEEAMARLAELAAPDDDRKSVEAAGDNWWLEIGPVDLNSKIVTVQRDGELIAAIAPREDGRLRVAVYRPLDAKSASYLMESALLPGPDGDVFYRENNWEYVLDHSVTLGNAYASREGAAYLSYWECGIGLDSNKSEVKEWRSYLTLQSRKPAVVATELGIQYIYSADYDDEPIDEDDVIDESEANISEIPLWESRSQQQRTVKGRFQGCLLGGAVGDALGAPVEFMSHSEIKSRYGDKGITSYKPSYSGIGSITDDTQMTLFTAEGLLRGWVRGATKGIVSYTGVTAHAYLRWLHTQGERATHESSFCIEKDEGWLIGQRALHHRRAPGNTCLSALRKMRHFGEPADNDRKGCGGVMRVAPAGLFAWCLREYISPQEAFRLGAELAGLTHGHPTGMLPAGVLTVLVMALTDGATLPDALRTAKACLVEERDHEETLRAVELAESLAAGDTPSDEAIAQLGQGWIAEEAMAISLYCALVARTFRQGVILAVNHDGDSDSTGAITGNLLGAMHGKKSIPERWLEQLELKETIGEIAEDLYGFYDWDIGEDYIDEALWEKYPGY
jgi:ADP-ribosylglycohydrolase